jgi:hypothetical protein
MASDVIKWVLLAGGAYLIYSEFFATPAASAAPAAGSGSSGSGSGSGSGSSSGAPSYVYTPPSTVQQLQNAAGAGVTVLDADQWAYYWTNTLGKTAIDPTAFGAIFFPNGRPSDPAQNPTMNASQFLAAIATKGISGLRGGLGAATPLWLPVVVTPGGAQRRRRSNYIRRST